MTLMLGNNFSSMIKNRHRLHDFFFLKMFLGKFFSFCVTLRSIGALVGPMNQVLFGRSCESYAAQPCYGFMQLNFIVIKSSCSSTEYDD